MNPEDEISDLDQNNPVDMTQELWAEIYDSDWDFDHDHSMDY